MGLVLDTDLEVAGVDGNAGSREGSECMGRENMSLCGKGSSWVGEKA